MTYAADMHMLKLIRDELHGGSWERMLADLRARLNGHPYIPKMMGRIRADIEAIEDILANPKSGKTAGRP